MHNNQIIRLFNFQNTQKWVKIPYFSTKVHQKCLVHHRSLGKHDFYSILYMPLKKKTPTAQANPGEKRNLIIICEI